MISRFELPALFVLGAAGLPTGLLGQGAAQPPAAPKPITFSDLVGSGKPIEFYGFIRMDAYYNTARANSVIIPATVLPENTTVGGLYINENDDQFAFDPRLTRIGLNVKGGEYNGFKTTGKIETDFANFPTGVPESRPTPRIRLAYVDLDGEHWEFRVGQDWDTISPLQPAINHELVMWNAGNLGDRRGQIRTTYAGGGFTVKGALGLTGAINNQDLDSTAANAGVTERDGFDSGMPHLQVRAGFARGASWANDKKYDVGVWGMFGRLETDVRIAGEDRFDTWLYGADVTIPIVSALAFRGEIWRGQALGDMRGGIGQTINTVTGQEISAWGGWAELALQANDQWKFHLGTTRDDPKDGHLRSGSPNLNWTAYVGTIFDMTKDTRLALDVIYWETEWLDTGLGNMVRFDLYCQMNF